MIEFSRNVHELQLLVAGLEKINRPGWRHELAEQLAIAAKTRVALEFENGKDPYGRPWAPLRSRDGKPLTDSGRLANSFAFQAAGDDVRIGTNVRYAGTHQDGAVITAKTSKGLRFRVGGPRPKTSGQWVRKQQVTIPQRQMIPESELGPIWTKDFEDEANAFLEDALNR